MNLKAERKDVIKNLSTLAHIRDVIAASDPRHDNKRPEVDVQFFRESAYELVALHLEGKAAKHLDIIPTIVAMLRNPGKVKAKTADDRIAQLIVIEIQQAILLIERQLKEI